MTYNNQRVYYTWSKMFEKFKTCDSYAYRVLEIINEIGNFIINGIHFIVVNT